MDARVFLLHGVHHSPQFRATLLTPENIPPSVVVSAWSSAIRYSAKGYDVPDLEAAVVRLLSKHPTWQVLREPIIPIQYDPAKADDEI